MADLRRRLEAHGLSNFAELFAESEVDFESSPELE